ncbi:UvrD Superfamily I DNA and RNA helicases [Flavobacteriaceae bacterium]
MNSIKLSKNQQEIVNLDGGAYLIKASAGSGKTRVLTERIKRIVNISKGKVLAITFTNKAGEELKERLGTSERVKEKVFVGTFHSFCQSILELRFKLLGYSSMPHIFEEDSDRIELIEQAIFQIPYFQEIYSGLEGKQLFEYKYKALNFISQVKRELISPEELISNSENEEFRNLYEEYQDILESNNAIDFDDLILLIYQLLINNESVANLYRKTYEYVCLDEAQDLNKSQYYLLKALVGNENKNIMMVGDPNQAIYLFNGSTSDYMENDFVEDFGATVYTLTENYRCSRSVIEASNKLMGLQAEAVNYVIDGIVEINGLLNEEEEANFVVDKIKKLIELKKHKDIEGEINYDNISILARNKYVFKNVESLLKENKMPYFYKSGNIGLKFSSTLMQIFDYYFRIKINPSDKLHLSRLEKLLNISDVYNEEMIKSSKFPESIYSLSFVNTLTIDNLSLEIKKFRKLFEENKVDGLTDDDRKLIIEDIDEFYSNWKTYQMKNQKRTLSGFKNSISLGITNHPKNENGITLSTVHTMKGQESDIVFIIGMDEGTFPDYRAVNKGGLELQQEKNNAYVAFTRSKRFLFVSYPTKRLMPWGDYKPRSISRFIK